MIGIGFLLHFNMTRISSHNDNEQWFLERKEMIHKQRVCEFVCSSCVGRGSEKPHFNRSHWFTHEHYAIASIKRRTICVQQQQQQQHQFSLFNHCCFRLSGTHPVARCFVAHTDSVRSYAVHHTMEIVCAHSIRLFETLIHRICLPYTYAIMSIYFVLNFHAVHHSDSLLVYI